MPMAAVIHEKGAPEVLRWESIDVPAPGAGEVRLRNEAVGLNFVDTYHRRGIPHPWPVPPLPVVLGFEGAGRVEAVGPGVSGFAAGDRVAYALPPHGAYSQVRNYPAANLLKVPASLDHLDDRILAAAMLKGLTVEYLVRRTYRVEPGDVVLVHAAAGATGLLLCQWAKHLGATVIGTVSSAAKAEQARAAGAAHVVIHGEGDFVATVREVTNGEGCAVVYESIGKDTFRRSLDCLRPARPRRRHRTRRARFPLSHPSRHHALSRHARRPGTRRARVVRRPRPRCRAARREPRLPTLGGRRSTPGARSQRDHRRHRIPALGMSGRPCEPLLASATLVRRESGVAEFPTPCTTQVVRGCSVVADCPTFSARKSQNCPRRWGTGCDCRFSQQWCGFIVYIHGFLSEQVRSKNESGELRAFLRKIWIRA